MKETIHGDQYQQFPTTKVPRQQTNIKYLYNVF